MSGAEEEAGQVDLQPPGGGGGGSGAALASVGCICIWLLSLPVCKGQGGVVREMPRPLYWTAATSHQTLFSLHSVEMNQAPMDPIYFIQTRVL